MQTCYVHTFFSLNECARCRIDKFPESDVTLWNLHCSSDFFGICGKFFISVSHCAFDEDVV